MNVLFLTLADINLTNRGIYSDLMRYFAEQGHSLYIVSPVERRQHKPGSYKTDGNTHFLKVRTLNIQKTNFVEKGLGTVLLETQFCRAIKKHLSGVRFDLILYSTPPITFSRVIRYVKKCNPQSVSYLLLKDIFPQNAVDLGMFSKRSVIYKYFRRKETDLYKLSDYIGCMSPKNVEFVLHNNPFIDPARVEVAPNSIEVIDYNRHIEERSILDKYGIPTDKIVFIYGGNLGKPQGIPFLLKCLEANSNRQNCHFVIVGNGTEFNSIKCWKEENGYPNVSLIKQLPKDEYDHLVRACDVGLVFLHHSFTIPNYPSRLLSYLQYKMPVIAATDPNTDIGQIAQENGYGFWCESNNIAAFNQCIDKIIAADRTQMGQRGYEFLKNNYTVKHTYDKITSHIPLCTDTSSNG